MVVLLGFTAVSVDGGYLYYRYTRLQDVSDSVALAASAEIMKTQGSEQMKKTAAFDAAVRYLGRNGLEVIGTSGYSATVALGSDTGLVTLSFADGCNRIEVDVDVDTNLFFARALSRSSTPVR